MREEPGEPTLLYVDLHLVHEVTSAQAFEGLRLAGRRVRRPELTVATMDHNVPTLPGPITDDARARAARRPPRELRRVRDHAARDGVGARGDRPRDRAGARPHAARQADRLRGQPHLDPRRLRGARVRHRHVRGRARPRHADAPPAEAEDDAARDPRRAPRGADRQGPHPRRDRRGRCRRGRRVRRRVRRRGDPRPLDGAADDGLQHVDRVGRPRRDGRAGRHDVRLPRGPRARSPRG